MTDSASPRESLRDEPLSSDVRESDTVFSGAVWNVRADRIGYGDGEFVRHYVEHTGAVAIVALDDTERVLLIQQYRHPIRMRDWELPAGLLDIESEDPLHAAQRELAEEADLQATTWHPLVSSFATPGGSNEIVHFYLATGLSRAAADFDRTEEEADIRTEWVPLDEAIDAVMDGRMRNGLLMIGLFAAARVRAGD